MNSHGPCVTLVSLTAKPTRTMGKPLNRGRVMFIRVLIVASLVSMIACSRRTQEKATLPPAASAARPSVRVVPAADRLGVGIARVSGAIRSKSEATLSARVTGQILKLDVRVGDRVKRGQVLAHLDSTNARIAVTNAKAAERVASANLDSARTELERMKALRQSDAVPGAQFDKATATFSLASAQLEQSQAAIAAARQQIADATLTAPFDGVVTAKYKSAGDSVAMVPPTPILTVTDPDFLEVRFAVPEPLVMFVQLGSAIRGTASPSGQPFEANVRVVGSVVDTSTRTVEVIADVTKPKDGSLRSGALVNVDLANADSLVGPFVPATAVRTEGTNRYVLVVNGDKLEKRDVVVVPINAGTVQVKSGLKVLEKVVVDAATELQAGDLVAVLSE